MAIERTYLTSWNSASGLTGNLNYQFKLDVNMVYVIDRYNFGKLIETFGSYTDKSEALNNVELLNKVDPFNDYKVRENESV